MKTFMANSKTVDRKWYLVDATNIPLGRLASQVASILRGKTKTDFTPNVDNGDFVIVINTDKIGITGKKLTDKMYYRHSMYPGGLKSATLKELMDSGKSEFVITEAVKGMLPKTRLGKKQLKKLKCYRGPEHENQAQKPVEIKLVGGKN